MERRDGVASLEVGAGVRGVLASGRQRVRLQGRCRRRITDYRCKSIVGWSTASNGLPSTRSRSTALLPLTNSGAGHLLLRLLFLAPPPPCPLSEFPPRFCG